MEESEVSYEIFKKQSDNSTVMVECVKGILEAQKRLDELKGTGPEEYFVFDPVKAEVIEPGRPDVTIDPLAP